MMHGADEKKKKLEVFGGFGKGRIKLSRKGLAKAFRVMLETEESRLRKFKIFSCLT